MDCGKITKGFVGGACGKLPIGGTGTRIWVFNHADIDKSASVYNDETDTISSIVLHSGKKGVLFETIENSNVGEASFTRGAYTAGYIHSVTMRIFKDSAAAKAWVNSIKDARLVVVVEKRQDGDSKFEVYGWESGLKLSDSPYSTTYTDNVALAPVISSDDDSPESDLPYAFYTESVETSEAALNALINVAA